MSFKKTLGTMIEASIALIGLDEENALCRATVLPGREDMLTRIKGVDTDQELEPAFSVLLGAARKELAGPGVVLSLMRAIDYIHEQRGEEIAGQLVGRIPSFIDALVDDREVAQDAKNFYEETRN